MNKRLLALFLSLMLILSSTAVFAANYDIRNKVTGDSFNLDEIVLDNDLFIEVAFNKEDYTVEYSDALYNLSDVQAKFEENPSITMEEAVKDLDPIDEPIEELKVVEVSAIDTTKVVTVKATAPNAEEEATADVAIFAYDEEGVRGETAVATATDVEIVEGAIEVEFEGLETGEYVAVVTVGEEEAELDFAVDFDAADAAVDAVNKAKNQVQLAEALGNDYFAEVYDEANIVEYAEEIIEAEDYTTVAEIIEDIEDINEEIETKDEFNAVKKALEEAHPNQLNIRNVLTANFDNVDAANIDAYEEVIFDVATDGKGTVKSELDALKKIQEAIDGVNDKAAADAVVALIDELADVITLEDKEDVVAARAAYEALTEEQQELVPAEKVATLEAAEDAIEAAEDDAELKALKVKAEAAIEALPAEIKLEHKAIVENARALVEAAQELDAEVTISNIDILVEAEKAITNARIASGLVENAGELELALANEEVETITLANGSYGDIIVKRSVTLVAENMHKAFAGDIILDSVENVTIDGFTAKSIVLNSTGEDITIINNVVTGEYGNSTVAIGAGKGNKTGPVTISNNTVLKGAIGLYPTDSFDKYTITENTIVANEKSEGIFVSFEFSSINLTLAEAEAIAETLLGDNTFGNYFDGDNVNDRVKVKTDYFEVLK